MSGLKLVGDGDFDAEVLHSDKLTLVEFGAEWCGPCKKLHPVLEELAQENVERIKVVEVDVGVSLQIATRFGIISVPQIMFFRAGQMSERVIGVLPKSKIQEKIDTHLK